jgi:hypothetical protein
VAAAASGAQDRFLLTLWLGRHELETRRHKLVLEARLGVDATPRPVSR